MVRKVDIAVAFIFGILIAVPLSLQFVGAWTGTQNTLSDGYMEVANVNATNYFLDDTDITDRLGGDYSGLGAIADTLDTGQGANELYDMDQNVLTSSDTTFASVNATDDFYLNGEPLRFVPYDYIIILEDGTFKAINQTGHTEFSGASAYPVLQGAINATTVDSSGNVVYATADRDKETGAILLGPYEFDIVGDTLLTPNHFSLIGSGAGKTIISFSGTYGIRNMWQNYTFDVFLADMMIEGGAGAGDTGIEWNMTTGTLPGVDYYSWWHRFENLYIRSCTTMIHVETWTVGANTLAYWNGIRGTGHIEIERVFDAHFKDVFCSTLNTTNIVTNHFQDWYIGSGKWRIMGGTGANPCKGNSFDGMRSDNTLNAPALTITGYFSENTFVNSHFANCRDTTGDNTEYAMDISGDSNYNTWTGCFIGNYPSRANIDTWKYLVYMRSGADNNTFVGNVWTFDQAGTGAIYEVDGPINDNNFENRKQTFYGGSSDGANPGVTEYCPIQGLYTLSTTQANRANIMDMSGYWANLRVRMSIAAGVGETYDLYLNMQGTDYLQVDIDGAAAVYGTNSSYAYHDPGAEPDYASIKLTPSGASGIGAVHSIVDFYPDLEDYLTG